MLRLEDLPGRVFLDTCVVNFILDHGEEIHENFDAPDAATDRVRQDIDALRSIFMVGARANWQLAISPRTYHEVMATRDNVRRRNLQCWFMEIWRHWTEVAETAEDLPSLVEGDDLRISVLGSGRLNVIPDPPDRLLIADAIAYRCDLFCTRDWSTILRHRANLNSRELGIDIVTPVEWWSRVRPYAALFV